MWIGLLFIVFGFSWAMSGVYMIVDAYFQSVNHTNRVVDAAKSSIMTEVRGLKNSVENLCVLNSEFKDACERRLDEYDKTADTVDAHDLEIKRLRERQNSAAKQRDH